VTAIRPLFRAAADETSVQGAATTQALQTARAASLAAVKSRFGARTQRAPAGVSTPDLTHVYLVELPVDADVEATAKAFSADPHVEYAQPDFLVRADHVPNDPYYGSTGSWGQPYDDLWGLKKIQAATAWDTTRGNGIVVAVVDTGADLTHPDLGANAWINPGETAGNGVDDDANGYVDDTNGWDFAYGDNVPTDNNGHGTHVSGTIAAVGDNEVGIIGVAPLAKIMAVKGLNDAGAGSISGLATAIVYAAENGADVINNSWGCAGRCPRNPVAEDAVRTAYSLGAVVVFAAGNSGDLVSYRSPQNMQDPKPVVVGASHPQDGAAGFSNVGGLMDFLAPGAGSSAPPPTFEPQRGILSLKSSTCAAATCPPGLVVGTSYFRQAGTSMAAPHAAGAAALVLAHRPAVGADDVGQILGISADDLQFPGWDHYTGRGRMNLANALSVASVPKVKISSPVSTDGFNVKLTGTVTITGTAAGPGFAQYRLYYFPLGNVLSKTPIGPPRTTPVVNGVLDQWTITGLSPSSYTLVLEVTTADGRVFSALTEPLLFEEDFVFTQITNDPESHQWFPAVSGDRIAWHSEPSADAYVYDAVSRSIQQITTTGPVYGNGGVDISGDRVVWSDKSTFDIYMYDLATGVKQQITTDPGFQYAPAISGNRIVWADSRNGNWDIYLHDLATGTEQQITSHPGDQLFPDIDGDLIVWTDDRYVTDEIFADIYLHDLATGTTSQITTDPGLQALATVSGQRVTWIDARHTQPGETAVFDVYLYDVATGAERRITSVSSPSLWQDISGDTIVWSEHGSGRSNGSDIFLYDLSTDAETRLTAHPAGQDYPAIDQQRVVWMDWRHGNSEIYLFERAGPPGPDLQLSLLTASPSPIAPGSDLKVTSAVQNVGDAAAAASKVDAHLSTDAIYGGTDDIALPKLRGVGRLTAGQANEGSITITLPAGIASGSYHVCARADATEVVAEALETNNTRCTNSPITVAPADLVVTSVTVKANPGNSTITVTTTVKNQGAGHISSFAVALDLMRDGSPALLHHVATYSVGGLEAGESRTKKITATLSNWLPPGTYSVRAAADFDNRRAESHEGNNVRLSSPFQW
jgi:beta propeller repeat protein